MRSAQCCAEDDLAAAPSIYILASITISTTKSRRPIDGRVLKPSPDHLLAEHVRALADAWARREMLLMLSIFVRQFADALVIESDAFIGNSIQAHNYSTSFSPSILIRLTGGWLRDEKRRRAG